MSAKRGNQNNEQQLQQLSQDVAGLKASIEALVKREAAPPRPAFDRGNFVTTCRDCNRRIRVIRSQNKTYTNSKGEEKPLFISFEIDEKGQLIHDEDANLIFHKDAEKSFACRPAA